MRMFELRSEDGELWGYWDDSINLYRSVSGNFVAIDDVWLAAAAPTRSWPPAPFAGGQRNSAPATNAPVGKDHRQRTSARRQAASLTYAIMLVGLIKTNVKIDGFDMDWVTPPLAWAVHQVGLALEKRWPFMSKFLWSNKVLGAHESGS